MFDAVAALTSRVTGAGTVGIDRLSQTQQPAVAQTTGPSFGEVLDQVVSGGAVQALRTAEATSISSLQGQASAIEVVEAIKNAEQALQTAISVRDKVVHAYQEISRMAI